MLRIINTCKLYESTPVNSGFRSQSQNTKVHVCIHLFICIRNSPVSSRKRSQLSDEQRSETAKIEQNWMESKRPKLTKIWSFLVEIFVRVRSVGITRRWSNSVEERKKVKKDFLYFQGRIFLFVYYLFIIQVTNQIPARGRQRSREGTRSWRERIYK